MGRTSQISYNTIGNMASLFFQWVIIMLIPKISDFSEAGSFAIAISISSILNPVATLVLSQYQVADGNISYSENDYANVRIITILLSFLFIMPISYVFGYGTDQILLIFAYMVYRNFINYVALHIATLQINNRLDYVGKCMIAEGFVSFISFVVTFYITQNLLLAVSIMAILGGGLFFITITKGYENIVGHKYGFVVDLRKVIPLVKIGIPLLISTICPIVITALPKLLLENRSGTELVGIFSTVSAPTVVIPTLATSIFAPFIVYFADMARKGDIGRIRRDYTIVMGLMFLLCSVCYFLSDLVARPLFNVLYGSELEGYIDCFKLLIIGIFIYSSGIYAITVLITKKQGLESGIVTVFSLLVSVIIFLYLIPCVTIYDACLGLIASYGVFSLVNTACVYFLPLSKPSR